MGVFYGVPAQALQNQEEEEDGEKGDKEGEEELRINQKKAK